MTNTAKRQSITPTYDSRQTGPRYWLSTFAAGRTLDWRKPIDDPFVSTVITIGWPDLLRALLHRRLVARVQVGGERDAIDDVLELDNDQLVPGRTRRDEFQQEILKSVLTDAELHEMIDGDET